MRASTSVRRLSSQTWTPLPFLCPSLSIPATSRAWRCSVQPARIPGFTRRCIHVETAKGPRRRPNLTAAPTASKLPLNCPGCGAYSQTEDSSKPGHYATARRPVKAFIAAQRTSQEQDQENRVFDQVKAGLDGKARDSLGVSDQAQDQGISGQDVPLCDRCHELLHHNKGISIFHPNMASLQDIIAETPHKYNHIYHVIDAADFPMSLIPRIQQHLDLTPQRSRNRRSKSHKFKSGRSAELSFVITRSDLLAPKKEQVDRMMPVLTDILRESLGRDARDVRLGNVRCVSSKRGWWTKEVKEDIWRRGGGQWMVGKVNVGKSNLLEAVFPKGRSEPVDFKQARKDAKQGTTELPLGPTDGVGLTEHEQRQTRSDEQLEDLLGDLKDDPSVPGTVPEIAAEVPVIEERVEDLAEVAADKAGVDPVQDTKPVSLILPPAAPEVSFPTMPTISHLPGTTAQPIRLRFGGGKGEMIDLPGLDRRDLTNYVLEDKQQDLVMRSRPKPTQISIKPGQSLLIGDLIRIMPIAPAETIFLAAPFVPLETHVTNHAKAAAIQQQEITHPSIAPLLKPGVGEMVQSAGWFELKWDMTKQRAGPLTRPDAVGLKPVRLPFVVYSADILIEGVGWVELAVQMRRRNLEEDPSPPVVEVFSPMGKHVSCRQPLGAYVLGGQMRKPVSRRSQRPRKSMKGVKKEEKIARRQQS